MDRRNAFPDGLRRGRLNPRIATVAALGAAIALALSPGQLLAAGQPQVFHLNLQTTFTISWCGLDNLTDQQTLHQTFVTGPNLGTPRQFTIEDTELVTNGTGGSLTFFTSGIEKDLVITHNPDGTTTYTSELAGVPERLIAPDGTVVSQDVGRVVFVSTFDANNNLLEMHVASVSGPHPDLASGFTIQCQVVNQYLG